MAWTDSVFIRKIRNDFKNYASSVGYESDHYIALARAIKPDLIKFDKIKKLNSENNNIYTYIHIASFRYNDIIKKTKLIFQKINLNVLNKDYTEIKVCFFFIQFSFLFCKQLKNNKFFNYVVVANECYDNKYKQIKECLYMYISEEIALLFLKLLS